MLYHLVRAGQWLAAHLPRSVRWWLGGTAAQVAYWCVPAKRLATRKNMSVVLSLPLQHPHVQRTARVSWRNYGRFMADFFDLPNHPPAHFLAQLHDMTRDERGALGLAEAARATGDGVVLASGHFGNWDLAGMLVGSRMPVFAIAEAFADQQLNELIQSQRRNANMTIIPVADALRAMLRHLRQGDVIATPIDRPVAPGEGIPIQFFGKTAYVPRGIGAISAKTGAQIIAGYVWYDRHQGFCIRAFPPVRIVRSGDEAADIRRATQVMFDALEEMIRLDPTQWYMFRQFWPDSEIEMAPAKTRVPVTREATRG